MHRMLYCIRKTLLLLMALGVVMVVVSQVTSAHRRLTTDDWRRRLTAAYQPDRMVTLFGLVKNPTQE
jgi:hypothetical protein